MKKYLVLVCCLASYFICVAQLTYKVEDLGKIPVKATVDPRVEVADYYPVFNYEAPHPDGGKYSSLKEKVAEAFPRKNTEEIVVKRSILPGPELLFDFRTNDSDGGIPPDNSFAMDYDGNNISTVNSNVHMRDADGTKLFGRSLSLFSQGIASTVSKFDPRVIYDPIENRFIMVWLAGALDPDNTTCIFAFSTTDDFLGVWNLIAIEGAPEPNKWFDYPMISITDKELFFTINLIQEDVGWQEGFRGTLIYQIDKLQGYEGVDPSVKLWSDIRFDGEFIRNLHPVKAADENLHSDMYFLSNRNFDTENDSIFILRIDSDQNDPDVKLDIQVRESNVSYGAPPNALQVDPSNVLATNDARILDSYRLGDLINFAGNSVDPATGKAAIYHGKISNLSTSMDVTGKILTHPTRDVGYPAMAWAGAIEGDDETMIVSQYSSETEFPGIQAMYTAWDDQSDWVTLHEGQNFIDILNSEVERWGDYTGCQRMYGVPGEVWGGSSFGGLFSYTTRAFAIRKAIESKTEDFKSDQRIEVYPNPTADRVTFKMSLENREKLKLALYDNQGRLIELFHDAKPKKVGELQFSFDLSPLESGIYHFTAKLGEREILSERVVKK